MADPHAFSGLVDGYAPPAAEDRPKVVGAPPAGQCAYCAAPSGTSHWCPKHTCTGGGTIENGRWRERKGCGRPVHRWQRAGEPVPVEPRSGPQDEVADYGARPTMGKSSEWIYPGLCDQCGGAEREARAYLAKLAEQGDTPTSEPRRGRGRYA